MTTRTTDRTTDRSGEAWVTSLREAFDRGFTEAPAPPGPEPVELLALRIGEAPWAVRRSQVAAVVTDRKVTPLPGSPPALLGLVGHRGALAPVWGLAELLDLAPGDGRRWLLQLPQGPMLAFEGLEGPIRVPPHHLVARRPDGPGAPFCTELCLYGRQRPILDLQALAQSLLGARPR